MHTPGIPTCFGSSVCPCWVTPTHSIVVIFYPTSNNLLSLIHSNLLPTTLQMPTSTSERAPFHGKVLMYDSSCVLNYLPQVNLPHHCH
jgi:hypothetical protein